MPRDASASYALNLALYEKLVDRFPGVERKGATMPYTSMNGNMQSLLTKEGVVALRLGSEDREQFIRDHKTGLVEQYGVVMKEYVAVPDELLRATSRLAKYFERSRDYVGSLRAKPTTRRKAAGKTPKPGAAKRVSGKSKAAKKRG